MKPSRPFHSLLFIAAAWFQLVSAHCRLVKRGISNDLLLFGTVLTSHGALDDASVLIQSGKIAYVGDICGLAANRGDLASVVNCTGSAVISPGFINTHEHIEYSTVHPLPDIGERVNHRHDWRVGARHHTVRRAPVNGSEADAIKWGELRHVFSGTTSIVGGEMAPGLARNLDFVDGLEDGLLDAPVATWDTFPLDDSAGILRNGDCDYGPDPISQELALKAHRYMAHIGEGVDSEAANEFACLSNMTFDTLPAPGGGGLSTDIISSNLALVHALGLTPDNYDMIATRGAKVVWSPRSNVYLYGNTMNVSALLQREITVAIGTDWLPSGSATMGREAVCAASVTKQLYGLELEPQTLWEMATINAAKVAGFEDRIGSIEVGKLADIVIFGGERKIGSQEIDPFAQVVFAPEEDVELVLRGGKILVATDEIKDLAIGDCEAINFGKAKKIVCVADELGSSYLDFQSSLQGVYPAILPGLPTDEPSCEPRRLPQSHDPPSKQNQEVDLHLS
ncbi:metal dependent amidohydrolase [Xylariaceae sp. FL1019]|nr:metal dependent amidohydrolase [Xylariaceae sp. FL1019]